MKKSLRVGAMVVTAAFATMTLASCGFGGGSSGGGDGSSSAGTTLDLLVPSYSDNTQGLWETVVDGFEKANPDIKVKLEVQSWDNLEGVIANKVSANEAPDIYNGGPFAGFADDGLLYPAKDVTSPDTFSDFQDSFVENASVDGTPYGLPFIASARALFVNNALLKEAGATVPTTWDELLASATKVSALGNGIAGYGMPLGSEEAQAEAAAWFFGGGGNFGDAKTIDIPTPENIAAAEFIQKMINAPATQADPGSSDRSPLFEIFIQGKIGMQIGIPPAVGQIAKNNPELDYSIVPIPTKDGEPVTVGVADHLMAFQNDDDKKEAITKFFDYFYSADVYVPWVQAEGFLPTTKSGADALNGEEALQPFLAVLPDAQFYPSSNPKWSATDAAFKALFGQLGQGKDATTVLNDIQAQVDAS